MFNSDHVNFSFNYRKTTKQFIKRLWTTTKIHQKTYIATNDIFYTFNYSNWKCIQKTNNLFRILSTQLYLLPKCFCGFHFLVVPYSSILTLSLKQYIESDAYMRILNKST